MPRETETDKLIPKIYRRKYSDLGLFFFVEGQKSIMPAMGVRKAIENYFRYVLEDNYDVQCAEVTFMRMKHEFIDLQRK